MIDINLLPYEQKVSKKLIWLIAAFASVCALALISLSVYSSHLNGQLRASQHEESVWKARSLKKTGLKPLNISLKPTPADAVDSLLSNRLSVFLTWTSINRLLPEGGTVVNMTYTDSGKVTVQCNLDHFADIQPFVDQLRKKSFSQVVMTQMSNQTTQLNITGFKGYLVTLTMNTEISQPINQ